MKIILTNADFSSTGIITPIDAELFSCTLGVYKGTYAKGTASNYNRTGCDTYFDVSSRTLVRNTGSLSVNLYLFLYDSSKNYLGYSTVKATGDDFDSIGAYTLAANAEVDVFDDSVWKRYLGTTSSSFTNQSIDLQDVKYFRLVIMDNFSENMALEISQGES